MLRGTPTDLLERVDTMNTTDTTCQWFRGCDKEATALVKHIILGLVQTCDRCVERMGLEDSVVEKVQA
jgi:hypothetical protein